MRRLLALLLVTCGACSASPEPVRIGAKSFDEQRILAHAIDRLVSAEQGVPTRVVECGETYECEQALRSGRIDLMVEYTGTALALSGAALDPATPDIEQVRAIYRPLGLRWLEPLGFENSYAVVVPTSRAASLRLAAVGDLAGVAQGVRIAAPPSYVSRPRDGLYPLLRRYGLRMRGRPLLLEDPVERYHALVDGRADVAVAYTTDGALVGQQLTALDDPLGFFPPYEAAVVMRDEIAERHPGIDEVVGRLSGRIDTETMRELNAEVQVEGRSPREVALAWLRERELIAPGDEPRSRSPELRIARHEADRVAAEASEALRVARVAFEGRAVELVDETDPAAAVASGRARLAVLGAERFFAEERGELPRREGRLTAVASLGARQVHLVRRAGDEAAALEGRVGVPPSLSGGALVAEELLGIAGAEPATHAPAEQLLERVEGGELDAALVLARAGDPVLARALADGSALALGPLPDLRGRLIQAPYLRPMQIPPGTYTAQAGAVETVGSQVVLAGAAPSTRDVSIVGPAAALRTGGHPLTRHESEAVLGATAGEMPDPILPSPWALTVDPGEQDDPRRTGSPAATVVNVFVWAFLGWLGWLLFRRKRA